MDHGAASRRASPIARGLVASAALILWAAAAAHAQGPQFDVGAPPGAAGGASTVGQPLGAADFPDFGTPVDRTVQRPSGPGGQPRARRRPRRARRRSSGRRAGTSSPFTPIQEQNVPAYGDLDLPEQVRRARRRHDDRRGDRSARASRTST